MASQGYFIASKHGPLYGMYVWPDKGPVCHQVLVVQPFAEEQNKSRKMLVAQARALAGHGIASLIVDLYGCGDSTGDLVDARWSLWQDNLADAQQWLRQQHRAPLSILALRLGALLAISAQRDGKLSGIEHWLLWQPVVRGATFVQQFLRLRLAAQAMDRVGEPETMAQLRALQVAEGQLEVAGYTLSAPLLEAIESTEAQWRPQPDLGTVHWLELSSKPRQTLLPLAQQRIKCWSSQGIRVLAHSLVGAAFWQTQEIVVVETLLTHSTGILLETGERDSRESGGG